MKALLAGLHRVLCGLLVLAVGLLIVPVFLQIFSRYVGFIPRYIWTEELARFCFIWMVMIGAMVGVREGTHFDVDLLPSMPKRANALFKLVAQFGVLVLAGVFLHYGWQWVADSWEMTSELADLPMWMIFISWPAAGLLWILFLGEQMMAEARILFGRTP